MNRREQAIRYLDGQMNDEEKLHFEKMLAVNPELQKETDNIRNFLSTTKVGSPAGN